MASIIHLSAKAWPLLAFTSTGTWYVAPPTLRDLHSKFGLTLLIAELKILIGSSLFIGSNSAKADWDYWAIDYDNSSGKNRIYTVEADGTATLRTSKTFIIYGRWHITNSM